MVENRSLPLARYSVLDLTRARARAHVCAPARGLGSARHQDRDAGRPLGRRHGR